MAKCSKEKLNYAKLYREKNKDKVALAKRNSYNKKLNYYRIKWLQNLRKYRKEHPWFASYDKAKQRCTNPKSNSYKNYGGKGIKFLMALDDFEFLWKRDNASQMKRPSIDRINSEENYELSNCRFIELSENISRSSKGNKHASKRRERGLR